MAGYTEAEIKQAIRNADKAGDSAAVLALGKRLAAMHQQAQPAPEQPGYIQSFLSGAERALAPLGRDAEYANPFRLAENALVDYVHPGATARARADREARMRTQAAAAEQAHQGSFGAGKVAGSIAESYLLALLMGGAARAVGGATRIGNAIATGLESGGFKTGLLPTRAAVKMGEAAAPTLGARLADAALRAGSGAVVNAAGAKLTGDDATASAIVGALMPTAVSAPARATLDHVIAPLWSKLAGTLGAERAGAIFRKAFNMTYQQASTLFKNAPEGATVSQVLSAAGKNEPTVQALAKSVAEGPGRHIYAPMAAQEKAAAQGVINRMAGGATAAERQGAVAAREQAAREAYAPKFEDIKARANIGGQQIPVVQRAAAAQRTEATQAAQQAKRMFGAADERAAVLGQADDLGDAFVPETVGKLRGEVGGFERQGEKAAQASVAAGAAARALENHVADLRAQGIDALTTQPIAARIRALANAEGTKGSAVQHGALMDIARQIEALGPIARAGDLDSIERGANDTIAKFVGAATDVSGLKRHAGTLVSSIKPVIRNAIEEAGGTGYTDLKGAFAGEMQDIAQQKFMGDLAALHEANPEQFASTVAGRTPADTARVEAAFPMGGAKNYDIGAMVSPERMAPLHDIARNVDVGTEAARQAVIGEPAAEALLKHEPATSGGEMLLGIPGKLARGVTSRLFPPAQHVVDFANMLAESGIGPATQKALVEGFRNGRSAEELLATLPRGDRWQVARRLRSNQLYNAQRAAGVNAFNALNTPPPPQNSMADYNTDAGY